DEPQRALSPARPDAAEIVPGGAASASGAAASDGGAAVTGATVPVGRSRRELLVAAVAGLGAALVLAIVYLAVSIPGAWFPRAVDRAFTATELKLADGTGTLDRGTLVVTAPGANDTTLVTLETDLRSADFPGVQWIVRGVPDGADVRMLWKTDVATRRTNMAVGVVEAGALRTFVLARDPAWLGRV